MTDLAEFLLARIAEDEAVAREASPGRWWWGGGVWNPLFAGEPNDQGASAVVIESDAPTYADPANADHITRWDPARVLTECEAKREIVELADRDDSWRYGMHAEAIGAVLRLLALPYADHADYRPEWNHPDYQPEWKP